MRLRKAAPGLAALGLLALGGCVTVPAYDPVVDQMLNGLLASTAKLYAKVEAGDGDTCRYDQTAKDWKDLELQARLVGLRLQALPNPAGEIQAAAAMQAALQSAEATHKASLASPAKCEAPAAAALDETAIEAAIVALQRVELMKTGAR